MGRAVAEGYERSGLTWKKEDYDRIKEIADKKGLTFSSYVRMVVLEALAWDPPTITYQNPAEWTTTGMSARRNQITGSR